MNPDDLRFDISSLSTRYAAGTATPVETVRAAYRRVEASKNNPVWISLVPEAQALACARSLESQQSRDLPLYGIPFAVKDNIDAAAMPTTAACPQFAYTPDANATVVDRLIAAGAILIGKTNLDQFATGLVGTRSPHGAVRNPFNPDYISGGSSSGSAVAVATGMVSFALGTDTAGSGRVPAGLNNIVGLKPTRGLISASGVVPACKSLDCISVFALTCADARVVWAAAAAHDGRDCYSRDTREQASKPTEAFRFGVPDAASLEFFGDREAAELFAVASNRLRQIGGTPVTVDLTHFLKAAELLYSGPWVAERYSAIRAFFDKQPDALLPVIREIIGQASRYSAADTFEAMHRLADLRRRTVTVWEQIDCLLVPTAGTAYTIAAVEADPIRLNSNLGRYTNFVNLLDLAALAVPSALRTDGLPVGITLIAPALHDAWLCDLGARYQQSTGLTLGATGHSLPETPPVMPRKAGEPAGTSVKLAVVGAHLSGQPLNHQLTGRGAKLLRSCRTDASYRLYALAGTMPPKPGLVRHDAGTAIEVEIWEMSPQAFGSFVAAIPAPLGIGTLKLDDGSEAKGFICETYATANAEDISAYGGWRNYLASR